MEIETRVVGPLEEKRLRRQALSTPGLEAGIDRVEAVGPASSPALAPWEALARSLAWPALLIAALRVGCGLLIERAALGIFGFMNFPPSPKLRSENSGIVSGFLRWDAEIFKRIAEHGYVRSSFDDAAFFPLYPATVRAVHAITHSSFPVAAIAVSWTTLWFATWGVMRLTRVLFPSVRAWRSGVLLAFFPVSVFLLAGYPESLYIALTAWTFVALAERRPWLSASLAALASITTPEGALLVIPLMGWYLRAGLRRNDRSLRSTLAATAALGVLCLSGFIAYCAFLWRRYGSPLEFSKAEKVWHWQTTWPLHSFFASLGQVFGDHLRGPTAANYVAVYLLNDAAMIIAVVGFCALCLIVRRRTELWWLIPQFAISLVYLACDAPFGTDPEARARLVMCIVPLYVVATKIRSELAWTLAIVGSALFAALFQVIFNTGGWLT
jgi:hypothetical protein